MKGIKNNIMSNKKQRKINITDVFLGNHIEGLQNGSLWNEMPKETLASLIEAGISKQVTKNWFVAKIVSADNKFLLNWQKRLHPLTDEDFEKRYGNEPLRIMLDDYKRRLVTVGKEIKILGNSQPDKQKRLSTKASCYRTIISELERALK